MKRRGHALKKRYGGREVLVYGVDYFDRKGVQRIEGPFTSEAQVDRVLLRVLPQDPDAMSFHTTAERFALKVAEVAVREARIVRKGGRA